MTMNLIAFGARVCLFLQILSADSVWAFTLQDGVKTRRGNRFETTRQASSSSGDSDASSPFGGIGELFKNPFGNLATLSTPSVDPDKQKRDELKDELLQRCQELPESNEKRALVEQVIGNLAQVSPEPASAASPLLQKEWKLIWTTEKEINFFLEKGWATEISQTINGENLQNMIPFVKGGSLGVEGTLSSDENNPLRTQFKFDVANLDLARWGSYRLPPVGEGWFDTVYLDDDLRVDLNSRNDILICKPMN